MPPIKAPGVSAQQPFHPGDQIGLGRFGHQVKMIAHQTIGMDLPAGFLARLAQCFEEAVAVLIIAKDRFSPVATIHQVVDGTWKLNSQWSWHGTISEWNA